MSGELSGLFTRLQYYDCLAEPQRGLKANINCSEASDLSSSPAVAVTFVGTGGKCYDRSQASARTAGEQGFALPQLFTYEHSSNTRGQFAVLKHYWSALKQSTSARKQSFELVVHQRSQGIIRTSSLVFAVYIPKQQQVLV